MNKNIPVWIKNTFAPADPGTLIEKVSSSSGSIIRGISSIHRIALLSLEGSGMVGIPGFSKRLFESLSGQLINVILITQASVQSGANFDFAAYQNTIQAAHQNGVAHFRYLAHKFMADRDADGNAVTRPLIPFVNVNISSNAFQIFRRTIKLEFNEVILLHLLFADFDLDVDTVGFEHGLKELSDRLAGRGLER
jgi:hypothetical protein